MPLPKTKNALTRKKLDLIKLHGQSIKAKVPSAQNGKIKMSVKQIADFKKLEAKYRNPYSSISNAEQSKHIFTKKKIWDANNKNIRIRDIKKMKLFGVKTGPELAREINSRYNGHISVGLGKLLPKFESVSNPHAISFKWRLDKETNTVHMFEWDNRHGTDSRNPLYQAFKKNAIERIQEGYADKGITKSTKFIVDSEVIDK